MATQAPTVKEAGHTAVDLGILTWTAFKIRFKKVNVLYFA